MKQPPTVQGEAHPFAKLKEADIAEIVEAAKEGEPYLVIAKRFGVTTQDIGGIARGELWRGTTRHKPIRRQVRLTSEQARDIYRRSFTREPRKAIAREFGISTDNIRAINKRRSWRAATQDLHAARQSSPPAGGRDDGQVDVGHEQERTGGSRTRVGGGGGPKSSAPEGP